MEAILMAYLIDISNSPERYPQYAPAMIAKEMEDSGNMRPENMRHKVSSDFSLEARANEKKRQQKKVSPGH